VASFFNQIKALVSHSNVRISEHGYEELSADGIFVRDVIARLSEAKVVEEYPDYKKGPCVLVLQRDAVGNPVHAVWGIPKGKSEPAVLVTAYRPDPEIWTEDFMRRKR
jgi:hypothetical protein